MKLYFVRHGKTLWNLEGRFQGANGDSPLLESSKDDLRQLARELRDISFDAIYSSDLKRAADTASVIVDEANCKTDISYTKQLREWNLEIGRAHVLNSSHANISYAVFCLKKKKKNRINI